MLNKGRLVFNKKIKETIFHLRIKVRDSFSALPGQFVNIRVDEGSLQPLLRRPFSIFNSKKGSLDIVYKVIGPGTKKLSEKRKGSTVDFIGPVGNSYIDFLPEETGDEKIFLAAGGTGFASIRFFAEWLAGRKIKFRLFYGARNKKEILTQFVRGYDAVVATDDGSYGKKGTVTDLLKKEISSDTIIFCCGPKPMLQAVQDIKAHKKFASFESYMGCANGVCLSCVIKTRNDVDFDYVRVCKEGTVFDLDDVIF